MVASWLAPVFGRLARWIGAGRAPREAPGAPVSAPPGVAPGPGATPAPPSEPTAAATWLVVGLGNPGGRYTGTRHNAGFDAVEALARAAGARFDRTRHGALVAEATVDGQRVVLALPQTFMNKSGEAVVPLLAESGLAPQQLLVVVDDLSLPLGALRLRPKGGSGGHNGLQSIADALADADLGGGSAEYPRLRVGIGNSFAPGFQAEYVLARFEPDEREAAAAAFERAAEAIRAVVAHGVEAAMTTVNRRS